MLIQYRLPLPNSQRLYHALVLAITPMGYWCKLLDEHYEGLEEFVFLKQVVAIWTPKTEVIFL